MKYPFFLLFAILSLTACNIEAVEPKFQTIENIIVTDLTSTKVYITADAVVYNPNKLSIFLHEVEIDVLANDLKVSHISQTKIVEIPKKDKFSIPLAVSFNPTELFQDNLIGLLASALSSYQQEKVNLTFTGFAKFEVMGVQFKVPIRYEDEILLKEE